MIDGIVVKIVILVLVILTTIGTSDLFQPIIVFSRSIHGYGSVD